MTASKWIRGSNRLVNSVGQEMADDIIDIGYRRIWAKSAPDGTVIFIEVDKFGNVIGDLRLLRVSRRGL